MKTEYTLAIGHANYAIAKFTTELAAIQAQMCFTFEKLKPSEYFGNKKTLIFQSEALETFQEMLAENSLAALISANHCLLDFPKDERENDTEPSVYVECLAAQQSSVHHGMWINCDRSAEDIQADIDWLLSWSPVRETEICLQWEITDSKGFYYLYLDEFETAKDLSALADFFDTSTHEECKALAAFIGQSNYDCSIEAINAFNELYQGTFESREQFAEDWAIENDYLSEMSKDNPLKDCIDWREVSDYLEHVLDYRFIDDGVYTMHAFKR